MGLCVFSYATIAWVVHWSMSWPYKDSATNTAPSLNYLSISHFVCAYPNLRPSQTIPLFSILHSISARMCPLKRSDRSRQITDSDYLSPYNFTRRFEFSLVRGVYPLLDEFSVNSLQLFSSATVGMCYPMIVRSPVPFKIASSGLLNRHKNALWLAGWSSFGLYLDACWYKSDRAPGVLPTSFATLQQRGPQSLLLFISFLTSMPLVC